MAAAFLIAGQRIYRRSLVKLSPIERAALLASGRVNLRRPVEWPLSEKLFDFSRAYPDVGGALWGPGPYLKVPNWKPDDDWEAVNRLFCPWGYPPSRLRVAWSSVYLQLQAVNLHQIDTSTWEWVLSVVPWVDVR
jgi:hypothetical protein